MKAWSIDCNIFFAEFQIIIYRNLLLLQNKVHQLPFSQKLKSLQFCGQGYHWKCVDKWFESRIFCKTNFKALWKCQMTGCCTMKKQHLNFLSSQSQKCIHIKGNVTVLKRKLATIIFQLFNKSKPFIIFPPKLTFTIM